MITVRIVDNGLRAEGLTDKERADLAAFDPLRQAEIASLRRFVESQKHLLTGRVLDYGAGKPGTCRQPQPYRDLCTGGYVPWEPGDRDPGCEFDAVLCTQVLQYAEDPGEILVDIARMLAPGGSLVLTAPQSWPQIEPGDRWRFTGVGLFALAEDSGMEPVQVYPLAALQSPGGLFILSHGMVAH